MSYSIETLSDDCYPGTNCLINKFNIQNERQLAFVESRIVIGKTMDNFVGLETEEFLNEITDFYCSTNMLHPFREGNGRTQRAFLQQLIRNAGYDLSFAAMDPDELMIATIQASNGVTDGLHRLLKENIRKG